MAYAQDKNLIKYTGRKYAFTFDLNTRTVIDGELPKKVNLHYIEGFIVEFYLEHPTADGLMEAIIKHFGPQSNIFYVILNNQIDRIKTKWKKFIQLDPSLDISEINSWLQLPFDMTQLEFSFFQFLRIPDQAILKKYAYQYAKYKDLLNNWHWLNYYDIIKKVDKTIETPSNLIDFLKYLFDRSEECENLPIINGIAEQYEKHKYLEGETDKYMFIVPSTLAMVKDEASQQDNCVYNLYRNKIADGTALVFFVRQKSNVNKSYITCEWDSRGYLRQCYFHHNEPVPNEIKQIITEYMLNKVGLRGY